MKSDGPHTAASTNLWGGISKHFSHQPVEPPRPPLMAMVRHTENLGVLFITVETHGSTPIL